jgi:hypothetical protein
LSCHFFPNPKSFPPNQAKVGFKAAPIHGTVHWSQFTPLLLQLFGPTWFESGSISVHFKTMVSHLQPVRAFASLPGGTSGTTAQNGRFADGFNQVGIWMELWDGRVVLEGTASVGRRPSDAPATMIETKLAEVKPVKGQLVFIRHPVGTATLPPATKADQETAQIDFAQTIGPLFPFTLTEKLDCITEYHPWFSAEHGSDSPWGRAILPPESLNQIMLGLCGTSTAAKWPKCGEDGWLEEAIGARTAVGLFGGCEVIVHNGPVFVGEKYHISRKLIAKGVCLPKVLAKGVLAKAVCLPKVCACQRCVLAKGVCLPKVCACQKCVLAKGVCLPI